MNDEIASPIGEEEETTRKSEKNDDRFFISRENFF